MKQLKREVVAYAGLTLMTVIIGFSFIFVKIALRHASPIDLLAHRFTAATAGLFFFYLFRRKGWPVIERKVYSIYSHCPCFIRYCFSRCRQ